jgi:hypothetical protein
VVDTDWYIEAEQPKARFVVDKEKAALHSISAETISQTLRVAVGGRELSEHIYCHCINDHDPTPEDIEQTHVWFEEVMQR